MHVGLSGVHGGITYLFQINIAACAIGRYGFACEGSCDCVNAVACDLEVGCVCEEGWTGPNCNQGNTQTLISATLNPLS